MDAFGQIVARPGGAGFHWEVRLNGLHGHEIRTSVHAFMLRTCDEFYAGLRSKNVQLGLVEYLGTYSGFVSCREPRDSTGDLRTVAQRSTRINPSQSSLHIVS